jgi:DNA-binding transcriptional MocR family regulator
MLSEQSDGVMQRYHPVADVVAADISAGRLRPGDRLPPQREFARRQGIANSTASRVYAELARRGLVVGEVGRGTFIRAGTAPPSMALTEPSGARVDLELNYPVLAEQPGLVAESLARLLDNDSLFAVLQPIGVVGTPAAREAAASLLRRRDWAPDPDRILFAGNGRQAIAATIAALVPVGERLGVEALTYPVVKAIAGRVGVTLVPLAIDENGLIPDAVRTAHRAGPLRAVYLQPTLHNPLGVAMPDRRRAELADILHDRGIYAIEDAVYGFLHDEPPLASLAPDHTVLVESLSKRLAPGLSVGFAVAPDRLTNRIAMALRSGGWAAQHFAIAASTQWISDGTAAAITQAKRRDATARQEIVRKQLAGFAIQSDARAYHCWWELPAPWRAETFVAAAARRGIAVTPAAAFAVGPGHAPNAVRLALGSPPLDLLSSGLEVLARLAHGVQEDAWVE